MAGVTVRPVEGAKQLGRFVDYAYAANAGDPHYVAPLRSEELEKFSSGKNPFFEHARHRLFIAERGGAVVGRIAAHIDELALTQPPEQGMGPGTGMWGALEADDAEVAHSLIAAAEEWLSGQGMTRVLAPINLSIWEEPGLLVKGHDHPPMVMMGHHARKYQGWIEAAGYAVVKSLYTYELDVSGGLPPLIARIVASGEKNPRIRVREVDLKQFDAEAAIIVDILNDAWSDNWGFVPITASEIAYTARKLKPLIRPDLVRIAELDGEAVAFMLTLPDLNRVLKRVGPRPSPLGWLKLLWWLRKPTNADMRVPLMGVKKKLQASRLASQLAFMMIELIRRAAVARYGTRRTEIGWVLDDNQGMNAIANTIQSRVNRQYDIYEKAL